VGCRASVEGEAKVGGEGELADFDKPLEDSAQERSEQAKLAELGPNAGTRYALLGARHDVQLAQGARQPVCKCIAAVLGEPANPAISWDGPRPITDPEKQLVIALSSEGVPCQDEPKESLGASYWGYRMSGQDVIVVVEAARHGRPVTRGAIIPKPGGDGQVYVAPATKELPYGQPLQAGQQLCPLGNPGARRAPPGGSAQGLDSPG
jgi:hypothetical protein